MLGDGGRRRRECWSVFQPGDLTNVRSSRDEARAEPEIKTDAGQGTVSSQLPVWGDLNQTSPPLLR